GNAQQGENGKPDESSKEQGSKENGKKQSGDQQKPGDGKEKGGDQPSDANDAKPNPDQAGKKAGGKNTGQEKKREDSQPNAGEDEGSDQSASGDGSKAPNANDNAQRFGPFEGGTDGSILKGNEEQTRVEVPKEESLVIRGLGREDPRLYRNKEGTAAQRELGSAEFKKPEAETSRERQPIPPEYSDLLR
ncbi:MAG: hypothetical protein IT290_07010, partial [Deltaproteobacteria bacterium]|nr:hypothetical protein [Deltaproteobacteria bacterium]